MALAELLAVVVWLDRRTTPPGGGASAGHAWSAAEKAVADRYLASHA